MNTMDKKTKKIIYYNQQSSIDYGWKPFWFDAYDFNEDLIEKVKQFQSENGLSADGMVGEITFRRKWTERQAEESHALLETATGDNVIICNGNKFPIKWDKVVTFMDRPSIMPDQNSYKRCTETRFPSMFVNHWDATLSSSHCARILNNRGLSVHFMIDNDGTILQALDTNHIAYHAGGWNSLSIGVEITNAYYPKYQSWYVKNGFGERPMKENVVVHNSKLEPFLGFYDVQLKALAALWAVISVAHNIPLEIPTMNHAVDPMCRDKKFKGFCAHYSLTKNKIDIAGVNLQSIRYEAMDLINDKT